MYRPNITIHIHGNPTTSMVFRFPSSSSSSHTMLKTETQNSRLAFTLTPISNALELHESECPSHRCTICNEAIALPRMDGKVEKAVMLPCSHVFGSVCIARWLESESLHKDCPNCRRGMVYSECGHGIKACEVDRAPPPISEKEMPTKCQVCKGGGLLEAALTALKRRQEAEGKALEGLRDSMTGVFGDFVRFRGEGKGGIEERIEGARGRWAREVEEVVAEVMGRFREEW